MKKKITNQGFSLIEVMIAMTIFSVFITVYITSQGYNLTDSMNLKEEAKLKDLCSKKLNEIIVKPPQFREALTLSTEVTTFEDDKNYEARVTYKRLKIPDLKKIMGKDDDESGGDSGDGEKGSSQAEAAFMNKVKENIQEMIWQVEVQVVNKETKATYTLSTWLQNNDATVKNLGSI